jgi:hypothetical protein
MNSKSFGYHAWNILEFVPWTFPKEILSQEDEVLVIRFSRAVIRILPCGYCRSSGEIFEKELGLISSLTHDFGGVLIITRSRWAKYWYDFHNRVNKKLEKPAFGSSWKDSVMPRPDWKNSFWAFIYAVCWNYPETDPTDDMVSKYYIFFGDLLPRVFKYTDLGKEYTKRLKDTPLTKNILKNRLLLCKWIYNMRCLCQNSCGNETWNFEDTSTLMEAFRARSQVCSKNLPTTREEAMAPKTCQ